MEYLVLLFDIVDSVSGIAEVKFVVGSWVLLWMWRLDGELSGCPGRLHLDRYLTVVIAAACRLAVVAHGELSTSRALPACLDNVLLRCTSHAEREH